MEKIKGVKALAFSGILAAITIVLMIVTNFVTGIGLLAMILIPMCASFVSLNVNWKYRLVYFCSCLLTFFFDPSMTLFILVPSLISGIILGILIKKYIQSYYIIFITAIIVTLLQLGSTYLINWIYEVDLIEVYSKILRINIDDFNALYYLFLFIISLIQVSLSYIIINNELKKLNYEFNEKRNQFIPIYLINFLGLTSTIILYFFFKPVFYLLIGFDIYFAVLLGYYIFTYYQRKKMLIIQLPLYFVAILGGVIFFSSLKENSTLIILFPLISQLLSSTYIIIYQKVVRKSQINESLFDKVS